MQQVGRQIQAAATGSAFSRAWRRGAGLVFCLLVAVLLSSLLSLGNPPGTSGAIATASHASVIVGFRADAPPLERVALVSKHGGRVVRANETLGFVVASVDEPASFMGRISQESEVRYAEPNSRVRAMYTPDDPQYDQQWALPDIKADLAWDVTMGSKEITIAIVDSGIDYDHPDLAGNYVSGGYDWVNDDNDPWDDEGHGTMCAGVAAAVTGNGVGVAGIAQVNVMAEKVLDHTGIGDAADVAEGIQHAVDQGANIISLSLGQDSPSSAVGQACQYAWDHGCLVVAAAGNDGEDSVLYPAARETVVCVGATDKSDQHCSFSHTGPEMELSAPGVSILSTDLDDGYATAQGTSMAAPHVAGVAALVWSAGPALTNQEVRDILTQTADDLGPEGWDEQFGYGKVDAQAALSAVPPSVDLVDPDQGNQGESLSVTVAGSNLLEAISLDFGAGITVDGFTAETTEISADISIAEDASLGSRDVTVTTPAGSSTLADSFTVVAATPPETPDNLQPEDSVTGVSLTPTLASSLFSDPEADDTHAASQWQVSTTPGSYCGDALVYDSDADAANLTEITLPPGVLTGHAIYYWRVRHRDNHDAWSDWSDETSFTTASRPPTTPTNQSPVDGATGVSLTPVLEASSFSDPDPGDAHSASQWRISTGSGGYSSPVLDVTVDTGDLTRYSVPEGTLGYSTTYYWQVRYQDDHNTWSDWSDETSFTTLNRPPLQPFNVSPWNGETGVSLTPTLVSTEFIDPDAGDLHVASQWQVTLTRDDYEYPVYDSGIAYAARTSVTLPAGRLTFATKYYWHVRHRDNHKNWSPWSEETAFTTLSQAPDQPDNLSPADGVAQVCLAPTLQSSPFSDADVGDSHAVTHWQLTSSQGDYSDPLFDAVVQSGEGADLTSVAVPSGELDYRTTYYWRVRYQDSYGTWSEWSEETSFTTVPDSSPPVTPVVDDYGEDTASASELQARWTSSDPESGIAEYMYAIGTSPGETDVVDWTSAGTDTEVACTGLTLTSGTTYYFAVKARNAHGVWSEVGVSDGIMVMDGQPQDDGGQATDGGGDQEEEPDDEATTGLGDCACLPVTQALSGTSLLLGWVVFGLSWWTGYGVVRRMGRRKRGTSTSAGGHLGDTAG